MYITINLEKITSEHIAVAGSKNPASKLSQWNAFCSFCVVIPTWWLRTWITEFPPNYSICCRRSVAVKIHLQSMKVWHSSLQFTFAYSVNAVQIRTVFSEISWLYCQVMGKEELNSWDTITFKYLDLYFPRMKLLLTLVSSEVACSLYICPSIPVIHTSFDSLTVWPIAYFLQQNCGMFLQLKRCEGKALNFTLLPPLPLTPYLPSLVLTTSSCHPQLSPQFGLSPPDPFREGYDECGISAKATLQGPVQQTHS